MYCTNCGSEVTVGNYCSNCGNYVGESTKIVAVAEPLTDVQRLKKAFSSKLFLAMAIIESVDVGLAAIICLVLPLYFAILPIDFATIVGRVLFAFCALLLVLPICELVGYWKTYRRNTNGEVVDASGPKLLSAVSRISYILSWIGAAVLFCAGGVCLAAVIFGAAGGYEFEMQVKIAMLAAGIVMIIVAVVLGVFFILYNRKIVKFWKDLAISAETGIINVSNAKSVYIWMLVMGIISGVSGLSGGITALIPAAMQICGSFWVKEYFLKNEQNNSGS